MRAGCHVVGSGIVAVTRRTIVGTAVAASALVCGVAVLSPQGLGQYRRLANEVSRLKEQNEALAVENAQRRRELEALQHSRTVQEKVVREDLGYVRPGEQLYIVNLPADSLPAATGGPARGGR